MCSLQKVLNPMGMIMGKSKFGSALEKLNPMSYIGKEDDKKKKAQAQVAGSPIQATPAGQRLSIS